MTAGLLALLLGAQPLEEVPKQTAVFYNARIAQRQKRPTDVLTLWLLRNSLVDLGQPGLHDGPFRSLVWAATGSMGLCQDGFARDDDEDGAGLWPLGLHNYVLTAKQPDDLPGPFEAYDVGRQQRLITLSDVLDREELETVTFAQTACLAPRIALIEYGLNPIADLEDRLVSGPLLRRLLLKSLETVRRDRVTTVAAIEARLFDIELALAELRKRRSKEVASEAVADVRGQNMSSAGAARQASRRAALAFEDAPEIAFLRRTLRWAPHEWLTLSRGRREFLFSNARTRAPDETALRTLTLGLIDALAERNAGAELSGFIGTLGEADRRLVTEGARGERLLALGEDSGFKERSVIALHRGIHHLERGELADSLRSFSFALAHSDSSKAANTVHPLARRWLSYVLSRYQANAEVLATLKALVPRQDFNPIVEDLLWAAALRADASSFDRLARAVRRGSAFDEKVDRLGFLAHGKPADLVVQLRAGADEGPFETSRFIKQLLDTLERDEADVRRANRQLIGQLISVLDAIASAPGAAKTNERLARELAGRAQALLEAMGASAGPSSNSRALELGHSTFAGSLRLAPADPLPWPFAPPDVEAPPAFTPFVLVPVEWRAVDGSLVFGWRITE